MNHLSRGGKNASAVRGTLWLDLHFFHILLRMIQQMVTTGTTAFPCLSPHLIPSPFLSFPNHGSVLVPQPRVSCSPGQPVKWTACSLAPAPPSASTSAPTSSSATYRGAARSPLKGNTGRDKGNPWCHVPAKAHPAHAPIQQLKHDMKLSGTSDRNPWNFSEEQMISAGYSPDLERACH